MRHFLSVSFSMFLCIPALGGSLPEDTQIVAKKAFVNQIGPFSSTTLFSPKVDGDFRISVYLSSQVPLTTTIVCYQLNWTDDFGAKSEQEGLGSQPFFTRTLMIHVRGEARITIDGTFPGCTPQDTTTTYNAYFTVERI
jgi:hypothetical protein